MRIDGQSGSAQFVSNITGNTIQVGKNVAGFTAAVNAVGNTTDLALGIVTARNYNSGNVYVGINSAGIKTFTVDAAGQGYFAGGTNLRNVTINLEPDNDANYASTTEEYTETETYTVEVPVIQTGVGTADLVDGDERETRTVTREREVTKTREIKTYTGPTLDVKEQLLAYEARFKQQDAVIAQMTEALKKLGADIDPPAAAAKKSTKKK